MVDLKGLNVDFKDVVEQSFAELGLDLTDDTGDDILAPIAEETEDVEAEDEADPSEESETSEDVEDTAASAESPNGPVIEISEAAVLVLPDGTQVPAKDAILFQKDYTKKTQQIAEERKTLEAERNDLANVRAEVEQTFAQMRDWYEERSGNPSGWIQEIVVSAKDPTATIARAIYELAQSGKLDPTFVETFGLDAGDFEKTAQDSVRNNEIAELRTRLEAREKAEQEEALIRRQAAEYQQQWEAIKANYGLEFSAADEAAAKRELFEFATSNRLTKSLIDAYDLMIVRTGKLQPTSVNSESATVADPEIVAKKRASRAVTPKSVSSGSGSKARPSTVRSAAAQSLEEFLVRA